MYFSVKFAITLILASSNSLAENVENKNAELLSALHDRPGSVLILNQQNSTGVRAIRFDGEWIHRYHEEGKIFIKEQNSPQRYSETPEHLPANVTGAFTGPDKEVYFFIGDKFCKRPLTYFNGSNCPKWYDNRQLFGCDSGPLKDTPICVDPHIDGVSSDKKDKSARTKFIFKDHKKWKLIIDPDQLTGRLFDENYDPSNHSLTETSSPLPVTSKIDPLVVTQTTQTTQTQSLPTQPSPTAPSTAQPSPTESLPTKTSPTEPLPTKASPTEPLPTQPSPTEPSPTKPLPTELLTTQPQSTTLLPVQLQQDEQSHSKHHGKTHEQHDGKPHGQPALTIEQHGQIHQQHHVQPHGGHAQTHDQHHGKPSEQHHAQPHGQHAQTHEERHVQTHVQAHEHQVQSHGQNAQTHEQHQVQTHEQHHVQPHGQHAQTQEKHHVQIHEQHHVQPHGQQHAQTHHVEPHRSNVHHEQIPANVEAFHHNRHPAQPLVQSQGQSQTLLQPIVPPLIQPLIPTQSDAKEEFTINAVQNHQGNQKLGQHGHDAHHNQQLSTGNHPVNSPSSQIFQPNLINQVQSVPKIVF